MDFVFENYSLLIISTIIFLFVYAVILNLYFIHKNGFHVSVNCWFCNKNFKQLYSNRNNFVCPFCSQYNGFNKDGGYNKIIEAQHNASLNTTDLIINNKTAHSTPLSSNGLCNPCNRNQELKIMQLAKYEPLNNKNYDIEIKHFEEQLEKTYHLCKSCSKIVKNTIRNQNKWIFGNKLKSRILHSKKKLYKRLNIINLILFVLSLLNVTVLCGLDVFLPKDITLPSNVILSNLYLSIYNNINEYLGPKTLPNTINFPCSNILFCSLLGFTIEFLTIFTKNYHLTKFNQLFSWIILILTTSINFKNGANLYLKTLETLCSLYLTYSYASTCIEPRKYYLKRIRLRDHSDSEEVSESESLNNTYKTDTSFGSKSRKLPDFNSTFYKSMQSPISNQSFASVRSGKSTCNASVINSPVFNQNLNMSFGSVRSIKSPEVIHKSTFGQSLYKTMQSPLNINFSAVNSRNNACSPTSFGSKPAFGKNIELNKCFNDLNIGPFQKNCQRPLSPNPFSRPQSPVFNQNNSYMHSPLQDNNSYPLFNQTLYKGLQQSPRVAPVRDEPINNSFLPINNDFSPRDTSSVISAPTNYSLRSRAHLKQNNFINNSLKPLSPNTFYSDEKDNGNISMPFHNMPNIWSNGSQKFVVSSLSNIQSNGYENTKLLLNNSRSSSSSSGFISNGEFANKGLSRSLPNSRENSPERNSLFSVPLTNNYTINN